MNRVLQGNLATDQLIEMFCGDRNCDFLPLKYPSRVLNMQNFAPSDVIQALPPFLDKVLSSHLTVEFSVLLFLTTTTTGMSP